MSTTEVRAVPRPVPEPRLRRQAIPLVDRLKDTAHSACFALLTLLMITGNWRVRPHRV